MDTNVKKYVKHKNNVLEMDQKVVVKNVILKNYVITYVKKFVIQIYHVLKNHAKFKLELFVLVVIGILSLNVE